ncbi:unnamed protein product [Psylliodes chrysocephalus]|uniref:Uncharacterized protein n=1 Tax=Psylliodes chrysocephalus TaxID=3402493 RepID=A0A9P0DBB2_9CUCU|nr:unnamed protein product [Psylliodes chrysocephala]
MKLSIRGLYFDGRKDKTVAISLDLKRRTSSVEEHIVLIEEPRSFYLGYVSSVSSSAENIFRSIIDFFETSSKSLENIVAVGCDGTVTNTGHNSGIIVRLEQHIKAPIHWFICQLHANELPLRHLIQHLDGNTRGPNMSGVIGKALQSCENLPRAKFKTINVVLPEISREILSTDKFYLYDICKFVSTGVCDDRFLNRHPGKLVHSRWLTTANPILRLYVSTQDPSNYLKILVEFVAKVYVPMWFAVKTKPFCIYGAKHLFDTIKRSRYLPLGLKNVLDPVIQRNGYFGHPENMLLTMLTDERKTIRELAVRRIIKIRNQTDLHTEVRAFILPKFNFDAEDYCDLLQTWQEFPVTKPPLLKQVSEDDLQEIVKDYSNSLVITEIMQFPCNTQAVKRAVKLVTESSL